MKSGFFVSCVMNREKRGYMELLRMSESLHLETVQNTLFPVPDFERALSSELRQFRSRKIFTRLDEHRSVLLVSNHSEKKPSAIYGQMRALGVKFDHVQRILPLDIITTLDEEQIKKYVLENHVEGSFKILYEGRLCASGTKERVFRAVLPLMAGRVELENPEYVVVVQAFKGHVGLSVVKNDPKNFNFSLNQ